MRLSNALRSRARGSVFGGLWRQLELPSKPRIHLTAATKLDDAAFWSDSLLGRSLSRFGERERLSWSITYENRRGLPLVYNESIHGPNGSAADVLVFLHDDVSLIEADWPDAICRGLHRFDVIGVAGNTRRVPGQLTWAFRPTGSGGHDWDHPFLSGNVGHGSDSEMEWSDFGPAPAPCELLDGVLLAANAHVLRASGVSFDPRYSFHFYDLDFCREARRAGLTLGTWPIKIVHASGGAFGSPSWQGMRRLYLDKWAA